MFEHLIYERVIGRRDHPVIISSCLLFCHLYHRTFFYQHHQYSTYLYSHPTILFLPSSTFLFFFYFSPSTHTLPNTPKHHSLSHFTSIHSHRNVHNVSNAIRAEFARGDGRVKRKEDERRKKISPSETLFVVNFHEETTKREDLQMLFEPYGRLVRIEMKRNYAFVQFETVEEASRAKDATNGGKLDQSEITVEFVARRMGEGGGRDRGRRDDYRGGYRGGYRGDRYDERRDRGGRRDDNRGGGYRGDRDRDYRRRSRSRSRSPGYRRRSPPRYSRRSRSRSPGYRGRDYDDRRTSDRGASRDYDRGYERSDRGYGER
mmetsp:Transcript_27973/g.43979  ORF Transcript_27973/g.43979 Transcript_27973/m.43979 type:complete len:318 (+) Transcript_27973:866-1819(+)